MSPLRRAAALLAAAAAIFIASAASCETIKVGFFPYDGYHMTDAAGSRSGYGYEYIQKLRIYTGWHYEYVGGPQHTWPTMLPMLENGSIDILTSVSKTPERLKKFDFSELPIGIKSTLVTVRAGNDKYSESDYSNWNGIRIGTLRSNSQNKRFAQFAAEHGFTYVAQTFSSSKELEEALQNGLVEAIVSSSLRRISNEWILARFDPMPYYICVKKGRRQLMAKIDAALEQLQTDDPGLSRSLYDKYYSPASISEIYYSREERAFIERYKKEGKVLTVLANPDRSPYSYVENGAVTGSNTDIAKLILSRTGLPYKFADVKGRTGYIKAIEAGGGDLVADMPYDYNVSDRSCYILTAPYCKASISQIRLRTPDPDAPNKAAVLSYFGLFNTVYDRLSIREEDRLRCGSVAECVDAVLTGRASAAYLLTNTAQEAAALDPRNRLIASKVPYVSIPFAIGVQDGGSGILPRIIQKAALSIGEEEAMPLTYKYLDSSREAEGFVAWFYDHPAIFSALAGCALLLAAALAILIVIYRGRMRERKLNGALNVTLEKLKSADGAKSRFLAQMSHEIRTPLNEVLGLTEIAQANAGDPAKVDDCLAKITISSRLLLRLINDILDMSAIEKGKLKIEEADFDFKKLITDTAAIFYRRAKEQGILFTVEMHGVTEEKLVGDELRTGQVLLNLLSNAMKFTPAGGSVTLSVTQASAAHGTAYMRFSVSDTGCGMDEAMQKRFFDPFEQYDASTARKHGGSGLGLSIAKRLTELMGGSISVKSAPDEGSVFTADIPFKISDAASSVSADFSAARTLVIDDSEESCEYCSLLLKRLGVPHEAVYSGREALIALAAARDAGRPYKLCIIDWQMPEMDGIELTSRIRREFGSETFVIIISAYDLCEAEKGMKDAGADYFVQKPLFQSTIFNLLQKLCCGSAETAKAAAAEKDERFDFSGKRVLIAEDLELNLEIAKALLEMTGFETVGAADGKEALDIYKSRGAGYFDAVLLDINMPVMDGYEAARAIRAAGLADSETIPIFAMTANAFSEDIAAALNAGMNGHIAKPIDTKALCAALHKAIFG